MLKHIEIYSPSATIADRLLPAPVGSDLDGSFQDWTDSEDSRLLRTIGSDQKLGDVLGGTSTAALDFDDAVGAREILAALAAQPRVVAATLGRAADTRLRRVDLPAPFSPMIPRAIPDGTSKSMPSSAWISRWRLFRPITRLMGSVGEAYTRYHLCRSRTTTAGRSDLKSMMDRKIPYNHGNRGAVGAAVNTL